MYSRRTPMCAARDETNLENSVMERKLRTAQHSTLAPVKNLHGVVSLSCADGVAFAVLADGSGWWWGRLFGADATSTDAGAEVYSLTPSSLGIKGAVEVAAGGTQACFRLSGGSLQCVGYNADGQLGDGTSHVANGSRHGCGTVQCDSRGDWSIQHLRDRQGRQSILLGRQSIWPDGQQHHGQSTDDPTPRWGSLMRWRVVLTSVACAVGCNSDGSLVGPDAGIVDAIDDQMSDCSLVSLFNVSERCKLCFVQNCCAVEQRICPLPHTAECIAYVQCAEACNSDAAAANDAGVCECLANFPDINAKNKARGDCELSKCNDAGACN